MDVKRCSEVGKRMALAQAALRHLVEAEMPEGMHPSSGAALDVAVWTAAGRGSGCVSLP
ncbi:MAG: hypothetical protein ABR978_06625 [Dehalococcoidia bacterium]|jgi:hypothetical protein